MSCFDFIYLFVSCAFVWNINEQPQKFSSDIPGQIMFDFTMLFVTHFIATHAPKSITQLKSVLLDMLVLWEEESTESVVGTKVRQDKWLKECEPIIKNLQHEEDIANEMEVRGFNLDQVDSFDEFVVQIK